MSAPRFDFSRISKITGAICLLPLLAALNVGCDRHSTHSEVTESVRVAPGSHRVTIPFYDEKRATIVVKTTIDNGSKQIAEVFLETVLKDADGNEVARAESGIVVAVGEQGPTEQWVNFKGFKIWTPSNPYLYTAHTIVRLGDDVIDTVESSFTVGSVTHADE